MSDKAQIDIYIGNKIKERRKQLKLSQQDLAKILSISYQQVQKYESGDTSTTLVRLFQIASALNATTEFFLEGAPSDEDIGEKIKSETISRARGRALEILLVEDNSGDQLLFRKAIEMCAEEVSVNVISDSEKVSDYLSNTKSKYGQETPDLVLLDLSMPKVSGMDILKQIKKNQAISHIPVIIVTNSVRTTDMEQCYKLGAAGFVLKSTDFDAYVKMISLFVEYWSKVIILPNSA